MAILIGRGQLRQMALLVTFLLNCFDIGPVAQEESKHV